ncbi:DASH family cryptochrome [Robertkochia marina]|uniref:Cryptochrome DASH n=1 Tax=Robertkochia marina TaxID=1227945 RepID=A0A4S3M0B0_9FLAO|nr:DASH family cryptochrome [Robertkochia marina]THD66343.1 DASH family cryptochrome [Robertkochia marina]TRZ44025.1 DASH family cryptochrome [Robertkochia marina]
MQNNKEKVGLIWFKNNLRVFDNRALTKACEDNEVVIAAYFFNPDDYRKTHWGFPKTGKYRLKFLLESLDVLQTDLQQLKIPLLIAVEKPEIGIKQMVKDLGISNIYTQNEWTAEEHLIIKKVKKQTGIPVNLFYDQFLIHPDDLPFTDPGDVPDVFTRFRKICEKSWQVLPPIPAPPPMKRSVVLENFRSSIPSPKELGLDPAVPDPRSAFPFTGGSTAALERIDHYFWRSKKLGFYKRTRNGLVGADYSSKLSPWLANGSISARYIYEEVKKFEKQEIKNQDTYWLIFELLWRDYFKYISMKYGNEIFSLGGILNRDYEWENNEDRFEEWSAGKTGNDFVDANMLELLHTGWMSNRGRQNVASYWAKELRQDWRKGAAWFEAMLIDYNVHSNWGNWMYASGVGNDPRDRKFNTKTQAERYDKNGAFRKRWLQHSLF